MRIDDTPILSSEIRVTRAFKFDSSSRLTHNYDCDENLLGTYNPTILNDKFTNVDNFELWINDDCIARFVLDSPINRSFFVKMCDLDLYECARLTIYWSDIFETYIGEWDSIFFDNTVRDIVNHIFHLINKFIEYIYYMCFDVAFTDYDTDIEWHLLGRWNKDTKAFDTPDSGIFNSNYYFDSLTDALQASFCFPNLEEFENKNCRRIVYIKENNEQVLPRIEVVIN